MVVLSGFCLFSRQTAKRLKKTNKKQNSQSWQYQKWFMIISWKLMIIAGESLLINLLSKKEIDIAVGKHYQTLIPRRLKTIRSCFAFTQYIFESIFNTKFSFSSLCGVVVSTIRFKNCLHIKFNQIHMRTLKMV